MTHVAVLGSFAARWRGEPGPPPNDIDVLVVGALDCEPLWDITAAVSRDLGIEVNAVLREPGAWEAAQLHGDGRHRRDSVPLVAEPLVAPAGQWRRGVVVLSARERLGRRVREVDLDHPGRAHETSVDIGRGFNRMEHLRPIDEDDRRGRSSGFAAGT